MTFLWGGKVINKHVNNVRDYTFTLLNYITTLIVCPIKSFKQILKRKTQIES